MAKDRQGKCTPEVIRKVCILLVKGNSWSDIAAVVDVSRKTLENWRNPKSKFYEPDFAKAIADALKKFDPEPIKARQIIEAGKHILKKKVKERVVIDKRTKGTKRVMPPPKMPPANCNKTYLINYAKERLGLRLDKKLTTAAMRDRCRAKIEELTEEVMLTVKIYEQEVDSNPNAVKNVMTNCGPEDERWNLEQEHKISTDDPLTSLIEKIALGPAKLPSEEMAGDERAA